MAQLVLNTLRAGTVEANTSGSIEIGGVVINNNVTYSYITSNQSYATSISADRSTSNNSDAQRSIVELGEQLYMGDLQLNDNATDVFGRPARYWEYEGAEIGTYAKTELLKQTYTTEVTGRDLYDLLGSATINDEDYTFSISIDGETEENILGDAYFDRGNLIRSNTTGVGDTGRGVLTEVYVDVIDKEVDIAIINTYLAKAIDDYDERNDEATYKVWSLTDATVSGSVNLVKDTDLDIDLTVSGDDFAIEDVQEDDIVLVRVADGEIQEMIQPEVMEGVEIGAFRTNRYVTVDGEQIDYADSIQYDDKVLDQYDDHNMKDTTYNVYLDTYGYAIGVEIVDEQDNYLFLTGMDSSSSNLTNRNLQANVIFADGTMDTVQVNYADSEIDTLRSALMNTWCEYTVDNNGVYTLTEVADTTAEFTAAGNDVGQGRDYVTYAIAETYSNTGNTQEKILTLDKSHVSLSGLADATGAYRRAYANDETVFLSVETELINNADATITNVNDYAVIISDVNGITTGIQNANLDAWSSYAVVKDEADYRAVNALRLNDVSQGVYTLFDEDGYVIAAIVVGEDNGTTTSYAFATSSNMNREAYDREADEYTWTREAVVNGEVVTLTEVGDTNPELKKMVQGHWYEVRYDADGNVRRVIELSTAANTYAVGSSDVPQYDFGNAAWTTGDEQINKISDVENAINDEDVVLLWDNLMDRPYTISVLASTLQVTTSTNTSMGFAVSSSANTVLIQDTRESNSTSINYMDEVYEFTGGTSGLERAINRLNNNGNFYGFIGAVFENGIATSIVIYDKTATVINTGNTTPGTGSGYTPVVTQRGNILDIQANTDQDGGPEVYSAAMNWLNENGYSVTYMTGGSGTTPWTFYAQRNGQTYYFTTNLITMVKFIVNGETVYYKESQSVYYNASSDGDYWQYAQVARGAAAPTRSPAGTLHTDVWESTQVMTADYAFHDDGDTDTYIWTGLYQVTVDSNGNPDATGANTYYYQIGNSMDAQLSGNWYNVGAVPTTGHASSTTGVTMAASMRNATIFDNYYHVTSSAVTPNIDVYVLAGNATTNVVGDADLYARAQDGAYVLLDSNGYIQAADMDRDYTIVDSGLARVNESVTVTPAGSGMTGMTVTATVAPNTFIKAGETVQVTLRLTANGNNATDDITVASATVNGQTAAVNNGPVTIITDGTGTLAVSTITLTTTTLGSSVTGGMVPVTVVLGTA